MKLSSIGELQDLVDERYRLQRALNAIDGKRDVSIRIDGNYHLTTVDSPIRADIRSWIADQLVDVDNQIRTLGVEIDEGAA